MGWVFVGHTRRTTGPTQGKKLGRRGRSRSSDSVEGGKCTRYVLEVRARGMCVRYVCEVCVGGMCLCVGWVGCGKLQFRFRKSHWGKGARVGWDIGVCVGASGVLGYCVFQNRVVWPLPILPKRHHDPRSGQPATDAVRGLARALGLP